MSGLSQIENSVFAAAVAAKIGSTAEALNRCFGATIQLQTAETQAYSTSPPGPELQQPGIIISVWVGDEAFFCALPEALPLPGWYTQPDADQQKQLDTLAMELAASCLPDELPGETFSADVVPSLWDAIAACEVSETACWLPVLVSAADGAQVTQVWMLWPSTTSPHEAVPDWTDEPPRVSSPEPIAVPEPQSGFSNNAPATAIPAAMTSVDTKLTARQQVLLSLPISIIVKLAEKKIELGQLMVMGPGTIVTFEKSCEDLLDLYVNNCLYCRGEAVKIGEKFGIKVNEVGSVEERVSAVLGWNN